MRGVGGGLWVVGYTAPELPHGQSSAMLQQILPCQTQGMLSKWAVPTCTAPALHSACAASLGPGSMSAW